MTIKVADRKRLWGLSGNRCVFCQCALIDDAGLAGIVGEEAHICSQADQGPRADVSLSLRARDSYDNLILVCPTDHARIDKSPTDYPVELLKSKKSEHERWVARSLGKPDQSKTVQPRGYKLVRPTTAISQPHSGAPSNLLRPERRLVELVGRGPRDVLDYLGTWLDGAEPFSVAVLHGRGGSGKSRLAFELMFTASKGGWGSAVVTRDVGLGEENTELERYELTAGERRLVVLDYAEADPALARRVLVDAERAAAERSLDGSKQRLLLLMRGIGRALDNFRSELLLEIQPDSAAEAALDSWSAVDIGHLVAEDEFGVIYSHAVSSFATALNVSSTTSEFGTFNQGATPLDVAAAALAHVLGWSDGTSSIEKVIGHERRYLRRSLNRFPDRLRPLINNRPERIVVTMSLLRHSPLQPVDLIAKLLELGPIEQSVRLDLAQWLDSLYPRSDEQVALQPDRLLETMADQVFSDEPSLAVALVGLEASSPTTLLLLARIGKTGTWLNTTNIDTEIHSIESSIVAAARDLSTIPNERWAVAITEFVTELRSILSFSFFTKLNFAIPDEPPRYLLTLALGSVEAMVEHAVTDEEKALSALNYSHRLAHSGRKDEADGPSTEAIIGYRELATKDKTFRIHLGAAILNRSYLRLGWRNRG